MPPELDDEPRKAQPKMLRRRQLLSMGERLQSTTLHWARSANSRSIQRCGVLVVGAHDVLCQPAPQVFQYVDGDCRGSRLEIFTEAVDLTHELFMQCAVDNQLGIPGLL